MLSDKEKLVTFYFIFSKYQYALLCTCMLYMYALLCTVYIFCVYLSLSFYLPICFSLYTVSCKII